MKDKIKQSYERLQTLQITATMMNMETILQTLYDLRSMYQELEEKEKHDDGQTDCDE